MQRAMWIVPMMLLLVTVNMAPAGATTTRVETSGTQQVVAIDDSRARSWTSADVEHVRGRGVTSIQHDAWMGAGIVRGTVNYNIDTTTWTGVAWGTFRSDFDAGGFMGTYRGRVHLDPELGPVGTFEVVARGWGESAGLQLRGTVTERLLTGTATYTATGFMPGDR
jgi:hypothetical protein